LWSLGGDVRRRGSVTGDNYNKAKLTSLLKTTQGEQSATLNQKHQLDCELLEDIKNYVKARSDIEKEYGQGLQKLYTRLMKKETQYEVNTSNSDHVTLLQAWKSILGSTDEKAQNHISLSDAYKNDIYEKLKECRSKKDNNLKKCTDVMTSLHNEVYGSVSNLVKNKKKYNAAEHSSQKEGEKVIECKNRLEKNNSFFKSKNDIQKQLQKIEQKHSSLVDQSDVARNDYILSITTTNAHLERYYQTDLHQLIKILDGSMFRQAKDFMKKICSLDLENAENTREAFKSSNKTADKICRDYEATEYIKNNQVLHTGLIYHYEKCNSSDTNGGLLVEKNGCLHQEAQKMATQLVRLRKQLKKKNKLKQNLEVQLQQSSTETVDSDFRYHKTQEDIRKLQTSICCHDSRLQRLTESGIDTEDLLQQAQSQLDSEDKNQRRRRKSTSILEEFDDFSSEFSSDDEFDVTIAGNDVTSITSSQQGGYPYTCTAIYSYQAQKSDELSIEEGESLQIVQESSWDQWLVGRNESGEEGFVPENYVRAENNHRQMNANASTKSSTSGTSSAAQDSVAMDASIASSSSGICSQPGFQDNGSTYRESPRPDKPTSLPMGLGKFKARYDYQGNKDDPTCLSFPQNAIIEVLGFDELDDIWYVGSYQGRTGSFPKCLVEKMTEDDEESPQFVFEDPPSFTPPRPYLTKNQPLQSPPPLPSDICYK